MKTIEGSKAFPYIAWITLLLFSMFTYSLVLQLQETVKDLEQKTQDKVQAVENT